MNNTLKHYLTQADNHHDWIDKFAVAAKQGDIESKITELQAGIRTIQAVAKRMADVNNILNSVLRVKNTTGGVKNIKTYPGEHDHNLLRNTTDDKKEIIPGVRIPAISVKKLSDIKPSPIYYVQSLKQYAINISGVVLSGGLVNILPYKNSKTARCDYGIQCKNISSNNCGYYHPPEDYIKLKLKVPDQKRSLTVGSWIYTDKTNPSKYYMRHLGGANTLAEDLKRIKRIQYKEEVHNREHQLMHDLLIYLVLHQQELLERYDYWPII